MYLSTSSPPWRKCFIPAAPVACNHGHERDGDHEVEIELASDADKVDIEIIDDGRPYAPLSETPTPNTDLPLGERPVGGLGVYLVCTLMDEASYRREDGLNRLTLVKRR